MRNIGLICIFLCTCIGLSGQSAHPYYFEQITVADGLSQNYITCIAQDAQGFIWIGTPNGLNKYDGYQIKEYNNSTKNPRSLINNNVSVLFSDSNQRFWIGTYDGLCYYCPNTDDFQRIDFSETGDIPANRQILSLYEDQNCILWIGTSGGTLYAYHLQDETLENYAHTYNNAPIRALTSYADSLIVGCGNGQGIMHLNTGSKELFRTATDMLHYGRSITSIIKADGELWLGSNQGLLKHTEKTPEHLSSNIYSLCSFSDSLLIVSTENNGLFEFNMERNTLSPISAKQRETNLNSNITTCLYAHSSPHSILWVGTTNGGVNKFDPNQSSFKYISLQANHLLQQMNHSVLAIEEIDSQHLLIGLDNEGICIYDRKTKSITYGDDKLFSELSGTPINAILQDSRGFLWIGTHRKQMKVTGPQPEQQHINRLIAETMPPASSAKSIIEDARHRIWIATSYGAVLCYHSTTKEMRQYTDQLNDLLYPNTILSLHEDKEGQIWVGSLCGLYRFSESKQEFEHVYTPDKENLSNQMNYIITIHRIGDALWLGTFKGLIEFIPEKEEAHTFTIDNGLSGNRVKGILFDEAGHSLWISTDKGLSKLEMENREFSTFGLEDGIINRQFNDMSYLRSSDGEFFFGTVNGIYHFHPREITPNPQVPKVIITSYQLYNNLAYGKEHKGASLIPVVRGNEIRIPSSESTFHINYAALNYTNSGKSEYAYRLEDFDNEWKYVGKQRSATFTNLNPGTYHFQVMASNGDGMWNKEGDSLKIVILPPWYRTIGAYIAYVVIALLILCYLMRVYANRVKMQSQLEKEQFERKQLEELNQLKMGFFSNITHEFRTSLTLILSPLDSMMKRSVGKKEQGYYLKTIQNNAIRLMGMVNEILDFSKSEAGGFAFKPSPVNLTKFLENEVHVFLPLMEGKQISLKYVCDNTPLFCMADTAIIQKITANLLSNAVKFTPEGGFIRLYLQKTDDDLPKIKITIEDSGKGIPDNQQQLIFNRFYQMKEDIQSGTGIGLTLVKNLVDLHHGHIHVESEEGKGSRFVVKIPFMEPTQLPKAETEEEVKETPFAPYPMAGTEETAANTDPVQPKRQTYTVLVAEDNKELRVYISTLLSDYKVLNAENGREAFEMAQKELPDVILSDVLMPEMDGKELCRQIKQSIHTCHIPFIMLTALVSEDNQKEGLSVGADDYLIKPFNPDILLAKISNILQNRTLISRWAQTKQALEQNAVYTNDKDSQFLLNLIEVIKANLSNSDLKVDDISKELGMSHTPFYKKIKQLTNQTPNDFIKSIRLEQAKRLLEESILNISEIAYITGFSSPKYFRECFKKTYGKPPTEFQMKK